MCFVPGRTAGTVFGEGFRAFVSDWDKLTATVNPCPTCHALSHFGHRRTAEDYWTQLSSYLTCRTVSLKMCVFAFSATGCRVDPAGSWSVFCQERHRGGRALHRVSSGQTLTGPRDLQDNCCRGHQTSNQGHTYQLILPNRLGYCS